MGTGLVDSKPILTDSIRIEGLKHLARGCGPNDKAHLYRCVWDMAIAIVGPVAHRDDKWESIINEASRNLLGLAEVRWEDRAGCLYIEGKRIWWSSRSGRFEQD